MSGIRIVVADDQALVRGALASLLRMEPEFEVVAEVGTGEEAIDACVDLEPDVAIIDVEMPGMGGIEATRRIKDRKPAVRVLIVTTFGRPGYVRRAVQSGADGFLVKDTPAAKLADAVRRLHSGLRVVDPTVAEHSVFVGDSPLTERETEVLREARRGDTTAIIARRLSLSEGTVRNHLSSAIRKTGSGNRAQAVQTAEENGWL